VWGPSNRNFRKKEIGDLGGLEEKMDHRKKKNESRKGIKVMVPKNGG